MKMRSPKQFLILLGAVFICLTAFASNSERLAIDHSNILNADEELKVGAFKTLKDKCNVCHGKKNPFMVFNPKNMVRRAPKIYRMVFKERKIPKDDKIRLNNEEYNKLEI